MKMLLAFAVILFATAGYAAAQDMNGLAMTTIHSSGSSDLTGFHATQGPGFNFDASKVPPNPKVIVTPQIGGVFVDGIKYGFIMISPAAPAEYGNGEKYLAAPSSKADLQHESGPAAHRDTGGIKLFSFEF